MLPRPTEHPAPERRLTRLTRAVRRTVLRRRRLLVAVLVAVAVASGLRSVAAPPPATVEVTVAATDLPPGRVLDAGDLRVVAVPPGVVPASAVRSPAGRTLAAGLRAGEPVTDVRLVGPDLTDGLAGVVALPVRLPDAGAVDLLRVGDEVDLLGADPRGGGVSTVAWGARVLALPGVDGEGAGTGPTGLPGRLVVVGVDEPQVDPLVAASVDSVLTFTWATR